jgi:hypothetical protein
VSTNDWCRAFSISLLAAKLHQTLSTVLSAVSGQQKSEISKSFVWGWIQIRAKNRPILFKLPLILRKKILVLSTGAKCLYPLFMLLAKPGRANS